ncbi:hypothetical protein C8F01DRAFT_1365625 [Mycena amicta]|nr:hypothetical protein C8F01DRAFT_1365625 [Mycena amicta]
MSLAPAPILVPLSADEHLSQSPEERPKSSVQLLWSMEALPLLKRTRSNDPSPIPLHLNSSAMSVPGVPVIDPLTSPWPSLLGPIVTQSPDEAHHTGSILSSATSNAVFPALHPSVTTRISPTHTDSGKIPPSSVVDASSATNSVQTSQNFPASTTLPPTQSLASPTASSQPTPGSRTRSSIPPILGAVAALLVVSVLAALFILWLRKRRQTSRILDSADVIVQDSFSNESGARVLALNPPNASARWVLESQEEALRKISTARRRSGDDGNATSNDPTYRAMAERMALIEASLTRIMSRDRAALEEERPPEYSAR